MNEKTGYQAAHIAANLADADLVMGLLRANGIEARIESESAVSMLDGVVSGNSGVPVMVKTESHEEAVKIIKEARDLGELSLDYGEGESADS